MLTCPKVRFCHTGSRASAPPVSERDQPSRRGPAERAAYQYDGRRQRAHRAPVHSAAASHAGSGASGTIDTAAKGG